MTIITMSEPRRHDGVREATTRSYDWSFEDTDQHNTADVQIARLARFIMEEVPGEPSQSEGAVECAIRIIREFLAGEVVEETTITVTEEISFMAEYEELDDNTIGPYDTMRDYTTFGPMEIRHRMGYHKPAGDSAAHAHQLWRQQCMELGRALDSILPEGRAKSLALTHLEETCMWGNKAIAELSPVVDE
jgi:hypothetical protein